MLKFDWNALRVGEAVMLHDSRDAELGLLSGTVSMVETRSGRRAANSIGIRVEAGDAHEVLWPAYQAVHHDPMEHDRECWRCDARVPAPPPARPREERAPRS
jgi:hypothetical protein